MNLNYKSFGEGPPVIILHGLFGMLDNWQSFGKKLASHFQVFLVDQRDHGKSPHTESFSYFELAEDLKCFLVLMSLTNVKLIGHSMGGKTIIEFASRYPNLIDKMLVVDMGIKAYNGGHETLIEALLSLPLTEIQTRKEADDFLSQKITSLPVRQFLMKNLSRTPEGRYRWKMNLELLHREYSSLMSHSLVNHDPIFTDTLFVRGGSSDYIIDEDLEDIRAVFPRSEVKTIQNVGHWIHAEDPESLIKIVGAFFGAPAS